MKHFNRAPSCTLMNCDGTILRLLTEHKVVEPWVAAIIDGVCMAAEREPDRTRVAA